MSEILPGPGAGKGAAAANRPPGWEKHLNDLVEDLEFSEYGRAPLARTGWWIFPSAFVMLLAFIQIYSLVR